MYVILIIIATSCLLFGILSTLNTTSDTDANWPALAPGFMFSNSSSGNTLHPFITESSRIIGNSNLTSYQHEVFVNESLGIYLFDCSGFITYVISRTCPEALVEIPSSSDRPRTSDYFLFFSTLPPCDPGSYGWCRVSSPENLTAGDIIVWKKINPDADFDEELPTIGHMVIVNTYPSEIPFRDNEYIIPITDSTGYSPHSEDTRPAGGMGIGSGKIRIKQLPEDPVAEIFWKAYDSDSGQLVTIMYGRYQISSPQVS